jgi:L,D-transpeptidase YcbB
MSMKFGHGVLVALVGAASCGAVALHAAAGEKNNWLTEQAFKRAQGKNLEENPQRSKPRTQIEDFSFFSDDEFSEPEVFFPGKRKKRNNYSAQYFSDDELDYFDPEPDVVIAYGKPKSPDDGFDTYEPTKLVTLSRPELVAPILYDGFASKILEELRHPENPVNVTAQQRDAIVNFYRLNNFNPLWVTPDGINGKAKRTLALLAKAEDEGLNALDYITPALESFSNDASSLRADMASLARFEISLTAMAIRYAEHLHSGRIIPNRMSGYYDLAPPALNLGQVLYELSVQSVPDLYLASFAPVHPAYRLMKASLAELRLKQNQDEQEPVPAGERVKVGDRDTRVPLVRERMIKLGLLTEENALAWMLGHAADDTEDASAHEMKLDKELSKALKAFQSDSSIKQTGQIDKATVDALNSRSDERNIEKLVLNMERLRWLPRDLGNRHIFVNQAAFELRVMDNEKILWNTKIIVGKPETQTYVFSDKVESVVLNPYWGVPKSILIHEMLPHLTEDPSYLDVKGFEVVDGQGQVVSSSSVDWWAYGDQIPYDVRQPPGDDNALGNIKFLFPNSHDIYMHDTPAKKLFKEEVRAFSHGCIRVENPRNFAEYVLGLERQQIDDMIASGRNQEIKLDSPVAVHLAYFTAWPDTAGKIGFYPDIYKRDTRLEKALNTLTVAAN